MAVSLDFEHQLGDPVMGIDEAGRGPLAGGVYAAAVHVPLARAEELLVGDWAAINDSKKLSPQKRDRLAAAIKATEGCVWAVASASPAEIDKLNILRATHLAMKRAWEKVVGQVGAVTAPVAPRIAPASQLASLGGYETATVRVLVDGLPVASLPDSTNVIKGDAKSLLIAAASILAKTARDEDCLRLERLYPGYGFARHKGYPTPAHYAALAKLGPCPEHRRSFAPVAQALLPL